MKIDKGLLEYFPDESIISTVSGNSYMIMRENSKILLMSLGDFTIHDINDLFSSPLVDLKISNKEISGLLDWWFSRNKLLSFTTLRNVDYTEILWITEKVQIQNRKLGKGNKIIEDIPCLIRTQGYHSLSFKVDKTPDLVYFNSHHESIVTRVEKICGITIPGEKLVKIFNKEVYGVGE